MPVTRAQVDALSDQGLIELSLSQAAKDPDNRAALKFLPAFLFAVEEKVTGIIIGALAQGFKNPQTGLAIMDVCIRELSFTGKINVLTNTTVKGKHKKLLKFLSIVNEIRNTVFHAKWRDLRYRGKSIRDIATRRDMVFDFADALHEATNGK